MSTSVEFGDFFFFPVLMQTFFVRLDSTFLLVRLCLKPYLLILLFLLQA